MIFIFTKPNFSRCEKLATELLAKQTLYSSRIDVKTLVYDKNIIFDSIQNYCKLTNANLNEFTGENQLLSEGCFIKHGDVYVVLYNAKAQSLEHLNWTLAHEIGHIYMGHIKDSAIEEIEAHFFAAQLLMPQYTIYKMFELGSVTPEDIYMLFNVSPVAANKRLNTLKRKFTINCTDADKKIYEMMRYTIEDYYDNYHNSFHSVST